MGQAVNTECQEGGNCGCFAADADNGVPVLPPGPMKAPPNVFVSQNQAAPPVESSSGGASSAWAAPEPAGAVPMPSPAFDASPQFPPTPVAPATTVSFDYILSDLEAAEETAYGEAFSLCSGGNSTAQMDNTSLRDFIITNSSVGAEDLDPHLFQVATEEMSLTVDGFLHVLRENAVSDTTTIEQFLGMASNGETCAAEECRSGLLLFSQRHLGANFSEEKWDRIFNTVMWDADVTVSMEKWIFYCKVVARIIRLSMYCRA